MEYCGDHGPHLPHETTGDWLGVNVCAGEQVPGGSPAEAALMFTLAAVLETKNEIGMQYGDGSVEALVGSRLETTFEKLADNLRAILEA